MRFHLSLSSPHRASTVSEPTDVSGCCITTHVDPRVSAIAAIESGATASQRHRIMARMRTRIASVIGAALAACSGHPGAGFDGPMQAADAARAADAAPPGADAPTARPPDWSREMVQADAADFVARHAVGGVAAFGVADGAAGDGTIARLVLAGDAALGSGDHAGTSFASEVATSRTFQFGTFVTRVRLAACAPGEDAVNGLFVFANDGKDHNGNQLADNDEIDIEILCGSPTVLFLSSWTDYQDSTGEFRKLTRSVDLADGAIADSKNDHEYDLVPMGKDPALARPGAISPDHYVEVGWTWRADSLRYFLIDGSAEVTLWDLHDAGHIPQHATQWMWNVWHPDTHWAGGGAADYPAQDAVLRVDRARYWAD
jgi:hypothetical protein